jgi:xylulokinase
MVAGLRHDTTREEILLAAYEGAAASLVEALDLLGEQGSGLDPEAAILLVGGGARGAVWQRVVARLSGRAVEVPDAAELVALGAATQAAACLSGEPPEEVARRWDTRSGLTMEAPAERDMEALDRIRTTREATLALHER